MRAESLGRRAVVEANPLYSYWRTSHLLGGANLRWCTQQDLNLQLGHYECPALT